MSDFLAGLILGADLSLLTIVLLRFNKARRQMAKRRTS